MMFAEGMGDVVEVEVQADGGRGADDAVAVERDELAFVEDLEVLPVVARLEALLVGQGGEADELQGLELLGVLGARVHDDKTGLEAAGVPEHGGILAAGPGAEQADARAAYQRHAAATPTDRRDTSGTSAACSPGAM